MWPFVARRVASAVPKIFVVVTLIFFATRLGPGDPAHTILGNYASEESVRTLRHELGLDRPLMVQYISFLHDIARLDLGTSYINNQPVLNQLKRALPYTLELTIAGVFLGALLGIPLGVAAAARKDKWPDYVSRIISIFGISFPVFVVGAALLILFSVKLDWFPTMGGGEFSQPLKNLYHLVLPALSLGIVILGYVTRLVRSSTLEILFQDYIRTAKSKGLPELTVLFDHALRNALIPIITIIGIYTVISMASSIMIEMVFNRPGLGTLIVGAIKQSDFPLVQASLMVYALFVIIINLIVDISYGMADPRVHLS